MTDTTSGHSTITARLLQAHERLDALPKHFGGRAMLRVEFAIYTAMREIAREYAGGYWHYYELSNGAFYMTPDAKGPFAVTVEGNGFAGSLSADAVGIVASLMGVNRVAFAGSEACIEQFYLLRDYALAHAEQHTIFRAID
jgi:hypothetical protein